MKFKSMILFFSLLLALAACKEADSSPPATRAASNLPLLVDLGADQCIPCKMMAPILENLRKDYAGRMDVVFIDVWKREEEAARYRVQMIPTQIFYAPDGKELHRHAGFISREEILATWKSLGYDFAAR